jgi:hypothetical protein
MRNAKTAIKTYATIDSQLTGAHFEQRWFESVVMVLRAIRRGHYSPEEAQKNLLEITNCLQWIQENLNEKLESTHRTLLKSIYSTNIQILTGCVQTRDYEYLDIVITALESCMAPYYRGKDVNPAQAHASA